MGSFFQGRCVPDGCNRPSGNKQTKVTYIDLKQHPKAKEILSKFDPKKNINDVSLVEKYYFDNIHKVEFCLFFGSDPVTHTSSFSYLYFHMYMYALHKLVEENIIEIYGFDSSSSLGPVKVSYTEEINMPYEGTFIVNFLNQSLEVIFVIYRYECNVDFVVYTKNHEDYSKFDIILREASRKYNMYENKVFNFADGFLNISDVTFDDIYLEDNIRKEVKENIIDYINANDIELKIKNGLPSKRGLIFEGIPGVGKSFLCRVLANTLKTTFMVVTNIRDICDITSIFNFATKFERIVILFEDIDIYIGDRDFGSKVVSTLLNELDGMQCNNNIIVLCTTNKLKCMDEALRNRPGRFDRILKFNSPSKKLKVSMLKGMCKNKDISQVDFEKVCESIPKNYTGAHIKEVYITSCNEAIKRKSITKDDMVVLTTDIFLDVIKEFKRRDNNKEDRKQMGFDDVDN